MKKDPIFIHSLFRSGSTYVFNKFRKSTLFVCFQEPLHENILLNKLTPNKILKSNDFNYLRHPKLDKPYFSELLPILKKVVKSISNDAIYFNFFDKNPQLNGIKYWEAIILNSSPKRALIQECRSFGKINTIKESLGGTHIFLWRYPIDQWWSYKVDPYFDITSLLILCSNDAPKSFGFLANKFNIKKTKNTKVSKVFEFYKDTYLTGDASYSIFYLLWCTSLLNGIKHCEIILSIDLLSLSLKYRKDFQNKLTKYSISKINFSDCRIPQNTFSANEINHYKKLNDYIHSILINDGWTKSEIRKLITLQKSIESTRSEKKLTNNFIDQGTLVRNYARLSQDKIYSYSRSLRKSQKEIKKLKKELSIVKNDLSSVYMSNSWKVTLPIRSIKNILLKIFSNK